MVLDEPKATYWCIRQLMRLTMVDSVYNVHSSYQIYTADGKLFKSVENHMARSDELPELVSLAAGFYVVEARSADNGYVRVRVVIKPSQRTVVDVDR